MKKVIIGLISVALLSGCKVELVPTVNLSDVNSVTAKTVQSKLIVEVMSCTDFEDSRKESSDVRDVKKAISEVFTDAKYIDCYREKMDSKALFEVPIIVGGKTAVGDIQITNAGFGGGMIVRMSERVKNKINRATKSTMSKPEPSITINLNNDLNSELDIVAHAVYLDNYALPLSPYTLLAGEKHTFKLSDVSVSSAFQHGVALIYEDLNNRMKMEVKK
ncbi:DUF7424 family protein [Gilliamella sp. wkB308]|uniref:DUF7424 family protein n=1 Tax=Gilliamella sp. wkB308 TaxID=3120263 RepID=UPI00080ECC08|nr:hypothetical protein [Gilliamella apicola]OCG01716.1 hypothetical protein A9G10_03065 [Gilliamella apicola]